MSSGKWRPFCLGLNWKTRQPWFRWRCECYVWRSNQPTDRDLSYYYMERNDSLHMHTIILLFINESELHRNVWSIWWRHQMETFSALLAICAGNSPIAGEFFTQRPVSRSFGVLLICAWISSWVNNRESGVLRRHLAHYEVIVMVSKKCIRLCHVSLSSLCFMRITI